MQLNRKIKAKYFKNRNKKKQLENADIFSTKV